MSNEAIEDYITEHIFEELDEKEFDQIIVDNLSKEEEDGR